MTTDPIERFAQWLSDAKQQKSITEPTAMSLATVDGSGQPSVRIVLLKTVDARGFVFYTNLESRKSRELRLNPKAALCFHWMPLERQVRIEGHVQPVDEAEANAYFASRPRESRIGAWSSKQSQPLPNREALVKAVADTTERFAGHDVPRPDFWSGWRLIPEKIEFWQQGDSRLHDREVYARQGNGWVVSRLYP